MAARMNSIADHTMSAAATVATTRATYDRIADAFPENTRDRAAVRAQLDDFVAAVPAGARVLDLGCGPGCDAALPGQCGLRPVGLDPSLGMLRVGAPLFAAPRVQADMRRLPLASASFDGVWAHASLLHLSRAASRRSARRRQARRRRRMGV